MKYANIYIDLSGSVSYDAELVERMLEKADEIAAGYEAHALYGFSLELDYRKGVWPLNGSHDDFSYNPTGSDLAGPIRHTGMNDAVIIYDGTAWLQGGIHVGSSINLIVVR